MATVTGAHACMKPQSRKPQGRGCSGICWTHLPSQAAALQALAEEVGKERRRIVHAHLLVIQRQAKEDAAQHISPTANCCSRTSLHTSLIGQLAQVPLADEGLTVGRYSPPVPD